MSDKNDMPMPKFQPGQVLRILHTWAKNIPPKPVVNVVWDRSWDCYTYSFPNSLIRIEEHELEPTGEPDMPLE